jgi:hypothetical protein
VVLRMIVIEMPEVPDADDAGRGMGARCLWWSAIRATLAMICAEDIFGVWQKLVLGMVTGGVLGACRIFSLFFAVNNMLLKKCGLILEF